MGIIYTEQVEYMNVDEMQKAPEWIVMYISSADAPTADYLARKWKIKIHKDI